MRYIFFNLLLLSITPAFSQDFFSITLEYVMLPSQNKNFTIEEVIDGRKNRAYIGWVETGVYNKKKFANLESPLEEEISGFISRTVISLNDVSIAIRVTYLNISEQTGDVRAEISLDYFLKEGRDRYFFITSTHSISEISGIDATNFHAENIGNAILKGIHEFSQRNWKTLINNVEIYSKEYLQHGIEILPDLSGIEIFNTSEYKEGIYTTFSDFLTNEPSITSGYEVKEGNSAKLWEINNGKKMRVRGGIYGFAWKNKLYVLFNGEFYELRKGEDTFYFTGPFISDGKTVFKSAAYGGAIGGAIAGSTSGKSYEYKIDLKSGFVIGSHGL